MTSNNLRIAIVGGGVCGLTCAITLLREGADVQVYEAAAKFGEVGAGIGQGPNALRILETLQVLDDIRARTEEKSQDAADPLDEHRDVKHASGWFKYISGTDASKVILDYKASETVDPGVHRAAFLDALVQHIPPERTHFHKRCTHVVPPSTPDGPVTIHFKDGTTAEADVVLGADGIKSAVRRFLTDSVNTNPDPYLKFSNTVVYRALVPTSKAVAAGVTMDFSDRPACFVAGTKHAIVFTIRGGSLLNIVASADSPTPHDSEFAPASTEVSQEATREELLEVYEGWSPEVLKLLGCVDAPTKWNINIVYPHLPVNKLARGKIAVLGDAAHAMLPHLGAGAGQGLEDAYLLGKLLGDPKTNIDNVEDVLRVCAEVRQPRVNKVWDASKRVCDMYEEAEQKGMSGDELHALWGYVWDRGVDDDVNQAIGMLVQSGAFST